MNRLTVSRKGAKAQRIGNKRELPHRPILGASFCGIACWRAILLHIVLLSFSAPAMAGGGPEGLLLVVNPRSQASMTIANHFAKLREIPPENIVYLPWDPEQEKIAIDEFRSGILIPLLRGIEERRLANQIDCIVYSSDFPWAVTLNSDIAKFQKEVAKQRRSNVINKWPEILKPVGSLNGMTYLWQSVIAESAEYFDATCNHYMRLPLREQKGAESAGFRGNRRYGQLGEIYKKGNRYFISMMLGVTAGRGNTLGEVISYLDRSAKADATHPKGTIYFVKNDNVRSIVRLELFPEAVKELAELGVAAEILEGVMPIGKKDVQGVMMGIDSFDWKASGSTILPGAICEHFTSYGGIMTKGVSQTPLSEFLRYGAAGASGTVTEPYSIKSKFPSAKIQVHYARGCTLAEAFYQSVHSPYQLLIVGDPLCRPWADIPKVSVEGVEPGAVVHGSLTLKPAATTAGGKPVEEFELIVDGRRAAQCKPGETLSLDTAGLPDGYHELRIAAVGPAPIESRGWCTIPVSLNNHGRDIETRLATQGKIQADTQVDIEVVSRSAIGIVALQGSRIVGRIAGDQGVITIAPNTLGSGPIKLRVVALGDGDAKTNVIAKPLQFTVQ